jgi:hypothetical protein
MINSITEYENGLLNQDQVIDLFVDLVNSNEIYLVPTYEPYFQQLKFFLEEGYIKLKNGVAYKTS